MLKIKLSLPTREDPCDIKDLFNSHKQLIYIWDVPTLKWTRDQDLSNRKVILKIIDSIEDHEPLETLLSVVDVIAESCKEFEEVLAMMHVRFNNDFLFMSEYFMMKTIRKHRWQIKNYMTLLQLYGANGLVCSGLRLIEHITTQFERQILCAFKYDIGDFFYYLPAYKGNVSLSFVESKPITYAPTEKLTVKGRDILKTFREVRIFFDLCQSK